MKLARCGGRTACRGEKDSFLAPLSTEVYIRLGIGAFAALNWILLDFTYDAANVFIFSGCLVFATVLSHVQAHRDHP